VDIFRDLILGGYIWNVLHSHRLSYWRNLLAKVHTFNPHISAGESTAYLLAAGDRIFVGACWRHWY
jgi:hypothetical protein